MAYCLTCDLAASLTESVSHSLPPSLPQIPMEEVIRVCFGTYMVALSPVFSIGAVVEASPQKKCDEKRVIHRGNLKSTSGSEAA